MRLIRAGAVLALLLAGCSQVSPPVVKQQTVSSSAGSIRKVAVVPFTTRAGLVPPDASHGMTADAIGDLVAGYMAEALTGHGVAVVFPSDVALAFLSQERPVPRRDPTAAAELAASRFGATSVVMGKVLRWRQRQGEAYGTAKPASVAFEMTLYLSLIHI